jgi:serine/threonine-protein phosphatase 4 catalytic subunit
MFDRKIVTVWSAPNYCYRYVLDPHRADLTAIDPGLTNAWFPDRCGNVASILELDENLRQEYKVFENAPHVSADETFRGVTY